MCCGVSRLKEKAQTSAVGEFRPVTGPSPVRPAYACPPASVVEQTAAGCLKANQLTAGCSRLRCEISRSSRHDSKGSELSPLAATTLHQLPVKLTTLAYYSGTTLAESSSAFVFPSTCR